MLVSRWCSHASNAMGLLTVINLLKGDLGIVRQRLLRLGAQHEGLWLLGSSHGCILRIHRRRAANGCGGRGFKTCSPAGRRLALGQLGGRNKDIRSLAPADFSMVKTM